MNDGSNWNQPPAPEAGGASAGLPPKKNWFLRHKILSTIFALILVGIIASAAGSSGTKNADTAATDPLTNSAEPSPEPSAAPPAPSPKPTKAAAPAAPEKPNDKGWVVQSLITKDDGLGDFGGTARITNTNDSERTAVFTFTLARGGQQIASLQGSAQQVAAGKTVTVQLISQDKYSAGKYTWDFQTDTSY